MSTPKRLTAKRIAARTLYTLIVENPTTTTTGTSTP